MIERKVTTVSLDPELVARARDRGLNISGVCEYALKTMLEQLENKHTKER